MSDLRACSRLAEFAEVSGAAAIGRDGDHEAGEAQKLLPTQQFRASRWHTKEA